jgi:hypothetical protein
VGVDVGGGGEGVAVGGRAVAVAVGAKVGVTTTVVIAVVVVAEVAPGVVVGRALSPQAAKPSANSIAKNAPVIFLFKFFLIIYISESCRILAWVKKKASPALYHFG